MEIDTITNPNSVKSELMFVEKLKAFPFIISMFDICTKKYMQLKNTNRLFTFACSLIEMMYVKLMAYLTCNIYMVHKENILKYDQIACEYLKKLESHLPTVKSHVESVWLKGKPLLNSPRGLFILNNLSRFMRSSIFLSYQLQLNLLFTTLVYLTHFFKYALNIIRELFYKYKYRVISLPDHVLIQAEFTLYTTYDHLKLLLNIQFNKLKYNYFNLTDQVMAKVNQIRDRVSKAVWDKFHVTKDKIDLYKEYLDVLSKQFTVQDGRSLNNVQSLEERTKIIIRRTIGNLMTASYLLYSKLKPFEPFFQRNMQLLNQLFADLFQILKKNDGFEVEDIFDKFLKAGKQWSSKIQIGFENIFASLSLLLVPNFDAFGVLDGFDDESSSDYDF